MITRGSLIVGLRNRYSERNVWLFSTLLFAALHAPNIFFGISFGGMLFQLVNTFIFGSFMYAVRRFSGTLIVPIVLHGLWDSSLFMPRATETDGNVLTLAMTPVIVVVAYVVIKRNKDLRLGFDGAVTGTSPSPAES